MTSYQDFFDKWNGKGCDFDGYYGFQCVDLADQYAQDVIGHKLPAVAGAKDFWNFDINGYDKINNTPTGVPVKGDIIIWGVGVGQYGHIAIFDHGDQNTFTSWDQNWPVNSLVHQQNHNYTGVLGWFHPVKSEDVQTPQAPVITDQTRIPQIENREVQSIRSELFDLRKANADLQSQLDNLKPTTPSADVLAWLKKVVGL